MKKKTKTKTDVLGIQWRWTIFCGVCGLVVGYDYDANDCYADIIIIIFTKIIMVMMDVWVVMEQYLFLSQITIGQTPCMNKER